MAATDIIAQLAVNLSMETASFSRGASAAEKRAQQMGKRFDSIGGRITKGVGASVAGFAAGIAGALTVGTIVDLTKRGLEYASSLGEQAQQLGVTTDELQKYRYAASQVGIEQSEMDTALSRLTKSLGEAGQGAKAPLAAFDRLGVKIKDSNGHLKSAGQIIPELAEALSKIPDPAARAAIETDLFGRAGQKLDTLLSGGAAGVNSLTDAATKLGVVLTPEQIAKADEAADKFSALKQVLEAKIAGFVADNADTILKVANAAADLGTKALQGIGNFSSWVQQVGQKTAALDGDLKTFNERIDEFDRKLGTPTRAEIFADAEANLKKNVAAIDAGLAAIQRWADQVDAATVRVWHAFETNWAKATAATARMVNQVSAYLTSKLEPAWQAVKSRASQAGDWFARLYDRVVGHSYIPDMVDQIGQHIVRLDGNMLGPIRDVTGKASAAFKQLQAEVGAIIERLYPEDARYQQFLTELQTLEAGMKKLGYSADQTALAVAKLRDEYSDERFGPVGPPEWMKDFEPPEHVDVDLSGIEEQIDKQIGANDNLRDNTKQRTAEIVQAYGQMANGVISSLRSMVDAFKHGDILSGLQSILDIVQGVAGTLVQLGVIKGPTAMSLGSATPRAQGGPVVPGRTYLVGENGPEYMRFGSRGYITPPRDGGGLRIQVVKGDLFDVIVDRRAGAVAAPMAARAAVAGASGGASGVYRREARRLP